MSRIAAGDGAPSDGMGEDRLKARRWRGKAAQCRALAAQMADPMSQASLRCMAATYEHLAALHEEEPAEGTSLELSLDRSVRH
jgi:hypothetical protein